MDVAPLGKLPDKLLLQIANFVAGDGLATFLSETDHGPEILTREMSYQPVESTGLDDLAMAGFDTDLRIEMLDIEMHLERLRDDRRHQTTNSPDEEEDDDLVTLQSQAQFTLFSEN